MSHNPFSQQNILSIRIAHCSFEYSSVRRLISGAHGNHHSPELITPTQWKDSTLARSQNTFQNASAWCYMYIHVAAFAYHPTTTHHAFKFTFFAKNNKSMKANFKASSKQNRLIYYSSEYQPLLNPLWDISVLTMPTMNNS